MKVDEFAQRVQAALDRGVPPIAIATIFGCNVATVKKWTTGASAPHENMRWGIARHIDTLSAPPPIGTGEGK